jgi:hypothetical protein
LTTTFCQGVHWRAAIAIFLTLLVITDVPAISMVLIGAAR